MSGEIVQVGRGSGPFIPLDSPPKTKMRDCHLRMPRNALLALVRELGLQGAATSFLMDQPLGLASSLLP